MTHPETMHDTTRETTRPRSETPNPDLDATAVETPKPHHTAAPAEQSHVTEPTNGHSGPTTSSEGVRIVTSDQRDDLQERWERIQAHFIDEPKGSVKEANELVSDVTKRIVESFQSRRDDLEQTWKKGDDVSTETLRVTLKRYRAFFDRLLTV